MGYARAMDADVAIIGGGPAGSTAATLLADAGLRTVLFERERFPRAHVGESLLPATLAILEETGVLPAVAAEGFVKKPGATMSWGRDREPWSWNFRETNRRFPHAYQVWRARFDQILLDHSRARGADVYEGVAVKQVRFEGDRAVGVTLDDGAEVRARMVVDASGQSSLIARAQGWKQWDAFFRNLAVYGYFRDCPHLAPPDEGNIFIESVEDGWLWKIPLAGGWSSIGAVVDREVGAKAIRAAGSRAFLNRQITAAPRIGALVGGREMAGEPAVVRDWSYASAKLAGPGYVLIGDAACFVDPLFSTGVHLAVSAAHIGAAYVVSALVDPPIAEDAATAFERAYRTQYEHFHELACLFYAGNRSVDSYFWQARRITGEQRPPREAFVRAVSGQSAAGYERAVLAHGVLPAETAAALSASAPRRVAGDIGATPLELAPRTRLERTAVLGDGRFEMGYAVRAEQRVDLPVSPLVAHLVSGVERCNGVATVAELAQDIAQAHGVETERVLGPLVDAARLLLADGVLVAREAR